MRIKRKENDYIYITTIAKRRCLIFDSDTDTSQNLSELSMNK